MSVIDQLASSLDRADEQPNIELAERIVASNDAAAIAELCGTFGASSAAIQSDAIKTLSEVSLRNPELVVPCSDTLLNLISGSNNRLVWGAMNALAHIAPLRSRILANHLDEIETAVTHGSVITQDWGVRALAQVAAQEPDVRQHLREYLIDFLARCRAKDLPKHAESSLPAFIDDPESRDHLVVLLQNRLPELTPPQANRVKRLLKSIQD